MEIDVRLELSSELTRIIECPYPASLSKLEDLLTRADEVIVHSCIHDRPPCAMTRLATLICDALPLWTTTSHILQLLCCSPEFTEKLFSRSPGLLNALLTKATSSQRDFDDYLELCVQLLSRPLPESIPLPASAHLFFLRVFERATQDPDVNTLQPVYRMLHGACRGLLGLLPYEVRQRFDRELCHILSSNGTGQNSMLLLWCFGIVILAEHPGKLSDLENHEADELKSTAGPEKQWQTASGRKLFGSPNGLYKTINLTYLSVIWATKGDVGVSDAEAIEGIRIAVRTLRFVDVKVRADWSMSSALAKNIFPKLPAKILRKNIHPTVQLEALCFYAMLSGTDNLAKEIVTQYHSCLTSLKELAAVEHLHDTLLVSLPVFAPQMHGSLFQALLSDILDACATHSTSSSWGNLITLVDALSIVLPSCAALRTKLLSAFSSSTLQGKAWRLVRTNSTDADAGAGCRTYAAFLHREAIASTISLLLSLVVSAQSNEPTLPYALATALITSQRKLPHVSKQCSHATSIPSGPSISIFQQESTPFTGQHLQDWRSRLRCELESQNSYQRDAIVRSVAQICQDLETRCNTVEEPLRREKTRSQQLEQRIEELRERVSSLVSQAADDRFHLDGLEDEKLGLADEKDKISARLDELQVQFERANRDANEAIRSAQEEFNTKELGLRSTMLDQEEKLRTREDEVSELSCTLTQVRGSLENAEQKLCAFGERYEDLQARHVDTNRQLNEEREAKLRQSEEVHRLNNRATDLEHQLQNTESELEAVTVQLGVLQVSHQELKRSSEDALRELEAKYLTEMEAAAARAKGECSKMNSKLADSLQASRQLKDEHDKTRRELHTLQNTFSTLEVKTQELDVICGEQAEELEELRTLRRNVLASMGLTTQNPLTLQSGSRSRKDDLESETPQESREHRRRKAKIQTQELAPEVSRATQIFTDTTLGDITEASVSFLGYETQDGSTPKRQKRRPSFNVATTQTPLSEKAIFASRSALKKLSPVKRSALRQVSPNRRHTTVGFALSETDIQSQTQEAGSAKKQRQSHRGACQEDFDMDDFLAGTPLTPGAFASGTGRLPAEDNATATEL